jgi:hypothetical protein
MKIFAATALILGACAATPAFAAAGLSFIIDGDTFDQPFSITNTSTTGESVLGFGFNLGNSGFVFDTVDGGVPGNGTAGVAFQPNGTTGTDTGLVGPVVVPDGATFFQIAFTNFGAGKTFSWDIDIDPASPSASPTVFGNSLIGTTAFVDFSNGQRAIGVLAAVAGNPDAAAFSVTSFVPTPVVPEPTTWAMMLVGFGMIGATARYRRRSSMVRYA